MNRLRKITTPRDILPEFKSTSVEQLILYHNFSFPFEVYKKAEIVIGMCMDNRKQLRIPPNFAYILRTGGGNLRQSEFKVSYAIAVGGVSAIALIGHDMCGMVDLHLRKSEFVEGLVTTAGWDRQKAIEHFDQNAAHFEIFDEIGFLITETQRIREIYPKILVAHLFYQIEDNRLYHIVEN